MGYRISEMFGGDGNGSWINTPMPANTSVHADSATAVADLCYNIYEKATGTNVAAWPIINAGNYCATINVIPHGTPLVKVWSSELPQHWNDPSKWSGHAMQYDGFPIPEGLEPTNDSDGTIFLYDPDWEWPGRPGDPQYKGRVYELWGAQSPEQNVANGLPARWTAKYPGRLSGVNNRLTGHPVNRTTGDALSTAMPTFTAPKAPNDTSANTGYVGYGRDGVAEHSGMMASASHIPMSHTQIRISDVVKGVINHPLGFALFGYDGSPKGYVWPATGYDGASRPWMKHGNRFRLPASYTATYPANMPVAWRPWFDMFIQCFKDYGVMLVDTTGNSFALRGEPGVQNYYPAGFNSNTFIKYLPWADMEMLVVGNDNEFYPSA